MVRAVINCYCDSDESRFNAVNVRFTHPVYPGDTLCIEMWKEGDKVICNTKSKSTGKAVFRNAYVLLHPAAKL